MESGTELNPENSIDVRAPVTTNKQETPPLGDQMAHIPIKTMQQTT